MPNISSLDLCIPNLSTSTIINHLPIINKIVLVARSIIYFLFPSFFIYGLCISHPSLSSSVLEFASWSPPTFSSQYIGICYSFIQIPCIYKVSLFTLTDTRLVSNFSMVTNKTLLFGNIYCILYGPNHFPNKFPYVWLIALWKPYMKHNHQN